MPAVLHWAPPHDAPSNGRAPLTADRLCYVYVCLATGRTGSVLTPTGGVGRRVN